MFEGQRRRWGGAFACILLVMSLGGETRASGPRGREITALSGVHVISVLNGKVSPDQTILIHGDEILDVGSTRELKIPRGARRIDGQGRFVIPGLADMHVHLDHVSDLTLYPAFGVTTVLNLRGLPHHLHWRGEIAAGRIFGPTLFTSGDYMDGSPPSMQPMMSLDSPADAARAVRAQHRAGYDFIKVYTRLSGDQFRAITASARELKMAVVGHTGEDYSLEDLTRADQANIAHGSEIARRYLDADPDDEDIANVAKTLAASRTTVTPNLNFSRSLIRQKTDLESILAQPEAGVLHPSVFQPFRRPSNRYARRDDAWLGRVRAEQKIIRRVTKALARAGVPLLLGTDSPVGLYPGDSAHEELEELVMAGLTPLQALRAATLEPGRFIGARVAKAPTFGRVARGYRADLVLLERNPLDDIRNSRSIAAVVMRGVFHTRKDLDARLKAQREEHAPIGKAVEELEQLLFSGEIKKARQRFDVARRQWPGVILFSQYVPFFVGYGYLYGEENFNEDPRKLEIALGLYQMYAETYPWFHSAHYMLAQALLANGKDPEARASLQRALEIHPWYPDARKALEKLGPADRPN